MSRIDARWAITGIAAGLAIGLSAGASLPSRTAATPTDRILLVRIKEPLAGSDIHPYVTYEGPNNEGGAKVCVDCPETRGVLIGGAMP